MFANLSCYDFFYRDYHFYNCKSQYAPSLTIDNFPHYRRTLRPGPGIDSRGQVPIPSDMQMRRGDSNAPKPPTATPLWKQRSVNFLIYLDILNFIAIYFYQFCFILCDFIDFICNKFCGLYFCYNRFSLYLRITILSYIISNNNWLHTRYL